jgi:hypothetical protein
MHSCIYAYWGWYWREVYHQIPLIIAQIVFVRMDPGLRAVSDRPEHEFISVVQAGLVLPAISDAGDRRAVQRIHHLEEEWAPRPYF